MNPHFRPTIHLYVSMGFVAAGAALLSRASVRTGDLAGADYFVFPFLRHGHGPEPAFFFPGSWALNFLVPSYFLSVLMNAVRTGSRPLAASTTPLFWYLWVPVTAIADVAADTLVPHLVARRGWPLPPLALAADLLLMLAVVAAVAASRGAEGEW